MPSPRHAARVVPAVPDRRWSWLVLGCIALVYLGTCFTPVIFDDNEGLYAGAVREMHARGDWLVPLSNGFPRVQKPPLVYWTMLISTSVLGGSEFALRLPNALATVGWIVATYLLLRRLGGERFGLASALILASMPGVWVFTHLVQPEPFLACFISLALWCLIEARASGDPPETTGRWYFRFWIFLALGTMSKGLHGALWPLGTVLLTAFFCPGWRPWLKGILSPRGLAVFALIVLPWYVYMTWRFPDFLSAHFINEQLGAGLNTRFPADARQLPVGQFYAQHLLFWLPWTFLLPASLAATARGWPDRTRDGTRELVVIFSALVMISVIFSTRQDYYSMACWGAVAAFFALPWIDEKSTRGMMIPTPVCLALSGICALIIAGWMTTHPDALGRSTATPIASRDTFMNAITGISPALWSRLLVLLWIFGAAMLLAGTMAGCLVWRRRFFPALLVLAGSAAIPICLAAAGFTVMSPYFSLAESARVINRKIAATPNALVACEARPNTASSLLYYLNARVHWVNAPFDHEYAQRVLGLGRDYYWDESALLDKWKSSAPIYFIAEESRLPYWQVTLTPPLRIVSMSGTRVVLCNQ